MPDRMAIRLALHDAAARFSGVLRGAGTGELCSGSRSRGLCRGRPRRAGLCQAASGVRSSARRARPRPDGPEQCAGSPEGTACGPAAGAQQPRCPVFLSKLADVLAQQEFMALARMAPDSARVHQLQGEGLRRTGKEDEAEREYLAALERRPGTPAIMNALGELKRQEKKCNEAQEWYAKVLEKRPGKLRRAVRLRGLLSALGRCGQGSSALSRSAHRPILLQPAPEMALGEALLRAGQGRGGAAHCSRQRPSSIHNSGACSSCSLKPTWRMAGRRRRNRPRSVTGS